MMNSWIVHEKPFPHTGLADWYAKQWNLQQVANCSRNNAFEMRNLGQNMRSETKIKTDWDTSLNNNRFIDRITEVMRWKELFENLYEKLSTEINYLKNDKYDAEREFNFVNHVTSVTADCISLRDSRKGEELTCDDVNIELKRELKDIDEFKILLTQRMQAAWEKLVYLDKIKFKLDADLNNKIETLRIDNTNLNTNKDSGHTTFKPCTSKSKIGFQSYESWLENCNSMKNDIENEIKKSYEFRDDLLMFRKHRKNLLRDQQDNTNYSLRKRIHETQKFKNDLEWQLKKTHQEMQKLRNEIDLLELDLRDKKQDMKCVQTRLEARAFRPGYEKCNDDLNVNLRNEELQLKQTQNDMQKLLLSMKGTYNELENLMSHIEINLDSKRQALTTDIMCLDIRAALKSNDRK